MPRDTFASSAPAITASEPRVASALGDAARPSRLPRADPADAHPEGNYGAAHSAAAACGRRRGSAGGESMAGAERRARLGSCL